VRLSGTLDDITAEAIVASAAALPFADRVYRAFSGWPDSAWDAT
jgi:hypothetical protein